MQAAVIRPRQAASASATGIEWQLSAFA